MTIQTQNYIYMIDDFIRNTHPYYYTIWYP